MSPKQAQAPNDSILAEAKRKRSALLIIQTPFFSTLDVPVQQSSWKGVAVALIAIDCLSGCDSYTASVI